MLLPWATHWPGVEGQQHSSLLPQMRKSGVRGGVYFRPGTWSRIFFAGSWAGLEGVVSISCPAPQRMPYLSSKFISI